MHYEKKVSVVITTCQRADLLPRSLESAFNQVHAASEVIVVIDGADADTETYLKSVSDPRLKFIVMHRQVGGCAARNIGVKAATGDWIAFLDDDDEWMPEKLQAQLKVATRSKAEYPVVTCRVAAVTPGGDRFVWPKRKRANGEHLSEYLLARNGWTQGEGLITTSMILAPRKLLLRIPFKAGLRRHQEWDWLLRASASSEVQVLTAWDVLATWNIEAKRGSVSKMDQWRISFDWIESVRRLVTPRAYASFLMVFVSAIAAREGDYSAIKAIAREVLRNGKPAAIEYTLMAAMWILPQTTRRRLRNFFVPQVQPA
jgi:glycosyltransferase involved in cell wall biosynthesis